MEISKITPPKAQIPVGVFVLDGRRIDVMQHPEFVRFFSDLFRRIGGISGASNTELLAAINSVQAGEIQWQPAQPLPQFADVMQQTGGDAEWPDVMQTTPTDPFASEMLWQS
jgi:hypothetical protein